MKDIHFAIMKSSIPFRLTGGKFFYVNRETMMNILKTTYSYISVLHIIVLYLRLTFQTVDTAKERLCIYQGPLVGNIIDLYLFFSSSSFLLLSLSLILILIFMIPQVDLLEFLTPDASGMSGIPEGCAIDHSQFSSPRRHNNYSFFRLSVSSLIDSRFIRIFNPDASGMYILCDIRTSWFTLPLTLMKDIHFAIMKSSIPFRLTGGKFFYVNRETMMNILKTTYSYISVLRIALLTK
ncbi:Odorant receptor 413 [Nylanderia fulva]|uniref:Odorant receptor 413 n=1 Tax=Nylanderia fulva TaxID=613905 RepID=A0A6G1LPT4_9HYME|nr:Odorant receptor 413 [Nylanderia fulva]